MTWSNPEIVAKLAELDETKSADDIARFYEEARASARRVAAFKDIETATCARLMLPLLDELEAAAASAAAKDRAGVLERLRGISVAAASFIAAVLERLPAELHQPMIDSILKAANEIKRRQA
jgi:molecular chaperone GrpE (heat shock protein)